MKIDIKLVDGIEEPVKLITGQGFAIGALTNAVYAWGIDYEKPRPENEEGAEPRLDGVE